MKYDLYVPVDIKGLSKEEALAKMQAADKEATTANPGKKVLTYPAVNINTITD